MKSPLIEFKNIEKKFGTNRVMQGVDLTIYEGETTTIIGKSGTGKSVLLKHIIGLMQQDSGVVMFSGRDIATFNRRERRGFKGSFSYMFQENALFDSLNIYDNIALPLAEKSTLSKGEIQNKVKKQMVQLEIWETASKYPAQLSGGMKKRVALARALVTDPDIVLFDEPTTGLDPVRKNSVHAMIQSYQKMFGFTAVIVSHEIPDIFGISQRIVMLDKGRTVFQGTPQQILDCKQESVRSFIHGKGDSRPD